MSRRIHLTVVVVLAAVACARAARAESPDVDLREGLLRVGVRGAEQGALYFFGRADGVANAAGRTGLLNEQLGSPNPYAPLLRMDERLESRLDAAGHAFAVYSYRAGGPGWNGLEADRTMAPSPDGAALIVKWRIKNAGTQTRAIMPRLGNDLRPGGTADARDTLNLPTTEGLMDVTRDGYYLPAQSWLAASDPIEKESFVLAFAAGAARAVLARWQSAEGRGFELVFAPRTLAPGATWETAYVLAAARGLTRVDFACEDLAAQAEADGAALTLRIAAFRPFPAARIACELRKPDGRSVAMGTRDIALEPGVAASLAFPLGGMLPGGGTVEARLLDKDDKPLGIGAMCGVPNGLITVPLRGAAPVGARVWNGAALPGARKPRNLSRPFAYNGGGAAVWYEPALEKLFRNDVPAPAGDSDPTAYLLLARNESESFQLALRPKPGETWRNVRVSAGDLVHESGAARINAADVHIYNVACVDIRVPSHLEGETGAWPDPLPPHAPFDAPGGENRAAWITVNAAPDLLPGIYRGPLELRADGRAPIALNLQVYVANFTLPLSPALRTSFATSLPGAAKDFMSWHALALAHRIALEPPETIPAETWIAQASPLAARGLGSVFLPEAPLEDADAMRRIDAALAPDAMKDLAFTAMYPIPGVRPVARVMQDAERMKTLAPRLAPAALATGLEPFLPQEWARWIVHLPVFQSSANASLLKAAAGGKDIWAWLSETPGPPFANLCIDRPAIEQRVIGWQCFALGLRGLRYTGPEVSLEGANYRLEQWHGPDLAGSTPANGEGLLIYPGASPMNSIRLETLRDAIEDYDYCALLLARLNVNKEPAGWNARARAVLDFRKHMPSLTQFSRDASEWLALRADMADLLEEAAAGTTPR